MSDTLRDVISQFANSPKLKAHILVFLQEAMLARQSTKELIGIFDIDHASGEHLNLIGRIVGQYERPYYDTSEVPWFSFGDGGPGDADLFGFNEGRLWDGRSINPGGSADLFLADDDIFRMFIKARIYRNSSQGTIQDTLDALEVITGRTDIKILGANGEEGPMQIRIHGTLRPIEQIFKIFIEGYDLLPIPAGVRLIEVL